MAILQLKRLEQLPLHTGIIWKNPQAIPPVHVPELGNYFRDILDSDFRKLSRMCRLWTKIQLDPNGREGVRLLEKREISSGIGRPMVYTDPEKILEILAAHPEVLCEKV